MRTSINVMIVIISLIIVCFAFHLITNILNIEYSQFSEFPLIILQLICLFFLIKAYKSTQSKSLKIFWQYFSLAVSGSIIVNLAQLFLPTSHLFNDFASLFSYFFVILAIETNPHSTETPINKYIGGRVPAIFFCVVCFCYFVLLPFEFIDLNSKSYPPSILFHMLITGLILIRLSIYTVKCQQIFWRNLYGYLFIGALILFLSNTSPLLPLKTDDLYNSYWQNLLISLPYFMLILSTSTSIKRNKPPKSRQYSSNSEIYILLLVLCIATIHFTGIEYKLSYIAPNYWQSVVIVGWLVVSIIFISFITHKKRAAHELIKRSFKSLQNKQESLLSLNKQLTKSIIYSENKAIVNASNNAILTTSTAGNILSANPAAVQIFQLLEQDLIASNVSKLFSKEDNMHYFFDFNSNVFSLQRKDKGITVECKAIRSDQSEFPVQVELQWAERQESPLIVITFINLTARKLAEKQALELKDKFIANISHEFRTPLTIINGVLDSYLSRSTSSKENNELTTAKRNGLRLVRMVEQLLELSRLNDDPSLSLSTFKLKTIMQMPADSFYRLAKQSNLSFNSNIPDNLWLKCDAQAFEKIIFNLLANAIKYTPSGGAINVNAYQEHDTIIVDILDTGIGINKESQAKIFERFQRAEDQKNHSIFGVGIGLSLVNELVKAHNWRISLVSEYNLGSKFTLSIPVAEPIEIEDILPKSMSKNELSSLLIEQNTPKKPNQHTDQQVVLIIEDNLDMQCHIKQVIEQAHHCLLATSGELGLTIAQEYIPDLIVCDIMLTGIDGFEVLKQLKENELTSHIPIILLTARSDLDSRLLGLNLHADDYLSKPFNQKELLVRIDNLIKIRTKLQQVHLKKFKKIQIDERKEAVHDNVSILTTDEHEIDSIEDIFLEKLEIAIAKMYIEPELGIVDLAGYMAMSERQLQRKIKVLLGTTPNNFIKEFRLKKAQELLKSGAQIGRIALDVGFSSQTYFGRCFKETFNCTPKQFQQRYLK